jgi:hypothetical protein
MWRQTLIVGLLAAVAACTGAGIDARDAIPARAMLSIRPVADGDPYVEAVANAARAGVAGVHVQRELMPSQRYPPIDSVRVRAPAKESLIEAVGRAEPVPPDLAVRYEDEGPYPGQPERSRWALVVIRTDQGMVLGSDTKVKPTTARDDVEHEDVGVYLLLGSDDARAFEQLTIDHEGRRLAILADEEVLMSPVVNEPIGGGQILVSPGHRSAGELLEKLTGTT